MQLVLIKYHLEVPMKHKSNETSICPVARSLDVIGEWWSLLIVREAMIGVKRFSDFQRSLGMAKNILSARLKRLVEAEVLEIVPASDGSAYQEYELTQKGRALLPTMVALRQWGEQFMFNNKDEHSVLIDRKNRKPVAKLEVRSLDNRLLSLDDIDYILPEDSSPCRLNRRVSTLKVVARKSSPQPASLFRLGQADVVPERVRQTPILRRP